MRPSRFPPVLAATLLAASAASAAPPEQVFRSVSNAIVVVEGLDERGLVKSQGSGVVVARGEIVTNCHVVHGSESLRVRGARQNASATLRYFDTERDLCQISAPSYAARPVRVGDSAALRVGQRVYTIGTPHGLTRSMGEGIVSSLRPFERSHYIQTSAPISPGSSGGGLFDAAGRLIGITTMQFAEGQNLNFAVPSAWIAELPRRASDRPASASDMAVQAQAEVLRINPGAIQNWLNLGTLYLLRGETDKLPAVQAALEKLHPDAASAFSERVKMAAK